MAKSPKTVEDEILGAAGFGGEDNDDTTDGSEEEAGGSEERTTPEAEGAAGTEQPTSKQVGDGTGGKPKKGAPGPTPLRDKDGNVIADGGKERRFYEVAQQAKRERDGALARVTQLEGELKGYKEAGTIGTQLNLSPDDMVTGAKMIAAWKANPVETIKYLLTEAQAAGHNLQGVISGGTDTAAIKKQIEEIVRPLLQDREVAAKSAEAESRAVQEYNGFVQKFPDARVHETSLARLLENDASLSPEAAYYKLRTYYLEKGLDWNKPLEVIAQEAAKASTKPGATRRGIPSRGANAAVTEESDEIADVSTSVDDIIKSAMRESGLPI